MVRLTDAVLPVGSELKAGVADALEASLRVDAAAVAAHHPVDDALVDVCRVRRRKSGVRAARCRGGGAKLCPTAGRTDAGLLGGRPLVPLMALAVVRSGRVDTVPVDTGVTHTLVHIWKREGRDSDFKHAAPSRRWVSS